MSGSGTRRQGNSEEFFWVRISGRCSQLNAQFQVEAGKKSWAVAMCSARGVHGFWLCSGQLLLSHTHPAPLFDLADLWGPCVDPGGILEDPRLHAAGLGDVCLRVLLRHVHLPPVSLLLWGSRRRQQLLGHLGTYLGQTQGSPVPAELGAAAALRAAGWGWLYGQCDPLGGDCVILLPQDVICQETAALFYLSAAVLEAYLTYSLGFFPGQAYRENIAAVVSAWQEGKEGSRWLWSGLKCKSLFAPTIWEGGRETSHCVTMCRCPQTCGTSRGVCSVLEWHCATERLTSWCFSITGICIRGHPGLCDPQGVLAAAMEIILRA